MAWRSGIRVLGVLLLVGAGPAAADTQDVVVKVLVCHATDEPGSIDPACRKLHGEIGREFRYESLQRLEQRRLSIGIDRVGSVVLPTGKRLRVRPLQVDAAAVLLAVDVEGAVKTDVRVGKGKSVVIGAERFRGGKLVISLEPSW